MSIEHTVETPVQPLEAVGAHSPWQQIQTPSTGHERRAVWLDAATATVRRCFCVRCVLCVVSSDTLHGWSMFNIPDRPHAHAPMM